MEFNIRRNSSGRQESKWYPRQEEAYVQRPGGFRALYVWSQHHGKTKRVWGRGDEVEFSREQVWQVLKATLCLQRSKEHSWSVNGARWPYPGARSYV